MTFAEEIQQKKDEMIQLMLDIGRPVEGQPEEETRQFYAGYVSLVEQAAQGNTQVRDEYIDVVIPATKQAGMPLSFVVGALIVVKMVFARMISDEHFSWYADFSLDYTERLIKAWESA